MDLLKRILPYLICLILGMLLLNECNRDPEVKTIVRTVAVPEIIKQFDTIVVEKPIHTHSVDTIYVDRFVQADSTGQLDLYKDAVTIREYKEVFEDSMAIIEVFSKTRGHLLEQQANYTIFERQITDTIPLPRPKGNLYLMPEIGTTTDLRGLRAKAGIMYQDRNKHLYSLSMDVDGYIYIGYGIKF